MDRPVLTDDTASDAQLPRAGRVIGPLRVESVAHGGHCVARHEGRVVFVRHTLPGEVVQVRLTDVSRPSYWRGDAIEIIEAASGRVPTSCPVAGAGGCGGCDFQHADPATQRDLKSAVLAEQLAHLAGVERQVRVEPVADPVPQRPGFGWRTRMTYVAHEGVAHMRRHRSNDLVAVPAGGCPLAVEDQPDPHTWAARLHDTDSPGPREAAGEPREVSLVRDQAVLVDGAVVHGPQILTEQVAGRQWQVWADGFWQVHPGAADTLVPAVLDGLDPRQGERAFDLYCGVGLFAGALADRGVQTWGVEVDRRGVELARRNVPAARFTAGRVDRVLRRMPRRTDLVVLDPPRTGAGKEVVAGVLARSPRAIAYVACDPAALGRDLARLLAGGYRLETVRAFDLFPQTHHLEAVAILRR